MPSPSSVTWTSTRGRGPAPDVDAPAEHGIERQARREGEPPTPGHGLDPVLDQVLEHLDEPVRVGPEQAEGWGRSGARAGPRGPGPPGSARRVTRSSSSWRFTCPKVKVSGRPRSKRASITRLTRSISASMTVTCSRNGPAPPSSSPSSWATPRIAPSGFRISCARASAICPSAESRSPRRTSASRARIRDRSRSDGDRAAKAAARTVDRRRQHAHRDRAPVGRRDLGLRLGPPLGQPDRLAQVPDQPRLGAQALGQEPLERARRRAPGERLGGAVPQEHGEVGPHADDGVRQARQEPVDLGHGPPPVVTGVTRAARVAWALSARSARSPAASRAAPAAAIIAALSVQSRGGGAVQR